MEAMQSIDETIQLWETMIERGETGITDKHSICMELFGDYIAGCPLCQYVSRIRPISCSKCPYRVVYGPCGKGPYHKWRHEETTEAAQAFLAQIYHVKEKYIAK